MSTLPIPETKTEAYLAKIAGEDIELPVPETKTEAYLNKIADAGILPDTSSASAGDTLVLDDDKKPVWGEGGGGTFAVTFTYSYNEYTDTYIISADHTVDEVVEAVSAGKVCIAINGYDVYTLSGGTTADVIAFRCVTANNIKELSTQVLLIPPYDAYIWNFNVSNMPQGALYVSLTISSYSSSVNKTYDEIKTAVDSGRQVIGKWEYLGAGSIGDLGELYFYLTDDSHPNEEYGKYYEFKQSSTRKNVMGEYGYNVDIPVSFKVYANNNVTVSYDKDEPLFVEFTWDSTANAYSSSIPQQTIYQKAPTKDILGEISTYDSATYETTYRRFVLASYVHAFIGDAVNSATFVACDGSGDKLIPDTVHSGYWILDAGNNS